MSACAICSKPGVGFIRVFQRQKKVGSYPACIEHIIMAWAAQEIAQDWIRKSLAQLLHIKRGAIPRFRVSATV